LKSVKNEITFTFTIFQKFYSRHIEFMAKLVTTREVRRFITSSLRAAGGGAGQCEDLADILVAADTRGHYSHGLNRLGKKTIDFTVKIYFKSRED
jgi:hypothetical protein